MAARPTCPVMITMGTESICAVAIPVIKFVAPGPEVAQATPGRPGHAGVAIGGVGGPLLVAYQDVAQLRVLGQRLVQRQDRPPGKAE